MLESGIDPATVRFEIGKKIVLSFINIKNAGSPAKPSAFFPRFSFVCILHVFQRKFTQILYVFQRKYFPIAFPMLFNVIF